MKLFIQELTNWRELPYSNWRIKSNLVDDMSLSSTLFLLLDNASGTNLCVTDVMLFLEKKRSSWQLN